MKIGYNTPITIQGETRLLKEWSKISGINKDRIVYRVRSGWDHQKAVFNPLIPPQESGLMVKTRRMGMSLTKG